MVALTEAELLTVWAAGRGQGRVGRALVLAEAGGADPASSVDLSIGQRAGFALALREECFGATFPCAVTCPSCAEELEIDLTVDDIRVPAAMAAGATAVTRIDRGGIEVEFRPVTSRDLLAVREEAGTVRRKLICRCVTRATKGGTTVAVDELSDDVLDAVSSALAARDPQADVLLDLDCVTCGHEWQSPFDITDYLWNEVETCARRLVHEVHALAGAYGWSEDQVLAVAPDRRQCYLELVTP